MLGEADPLALGRYPVNRGTVLKQCDQRRADPREAHFAGFDLGQVEDFVDQVEQVFAALLDHPRVFLVAGVVEFVLEQFGKAEDAVERRAQLMRHGGQEGRFLAAGFLGLLAGLFEALEGFLDRIGHPVEGAGQFAHLVGRAGVEAAFQVAFLEGVDARDHAGDAPGQQPGHPDGDADDDDHHEQRRTPQAERGVGQAALIGCVISSMVLTASLDLMNYQQI